MPAPPEFQELWQTQGHPLGPTEGKLRPREEWYNESVAELGLERGLRATFRLWREREWARAQPVQVKFRRD